VFSQTTINNNRSFLSSPASINIVIAVVIAVVVVVASLLPYSYNPLVLDVQESQSTHQGGGSRFATIAVTRCIRVDLDTLGSTRYADNQPPIHLHRHRVDSKSTQQQQQRNQQYYGN
jgi:hypothetical protein